MIVRPAGLDAEIMDGGETPEAVAEYDAWCRKNILVDALEIYGVDLDAVADVINAGGCGRVLYISCVGEMHIRMTPPADGWMLLFDLTDMHANSDPNVPWDDDAVLDYIQQWSEERQIVYCP
jgi:hypothetical protein